jgi:FkbH-like protein
VPNQPPRIIIASSFTANPLLESIQFWTRQLNLPHETAIVGYQQLFQELLNPRRLFAQNQRGANVVLFRLEDLATSAEAATRIEEHAFELADTLISAAAQFPVPLLVCVCPASRLFHETATHRDLIHLLSQKIGARLERQPNLYWLSAQTIAADYQVAQVTDQIADKIGHVPYSPEFFAALGTQIVRTVLALERKPVKVIAVDCDNTLWSGVCGEDGPENVELDAGRQAFQSFLLEQKQAGVLLVIVSKNNEQDVRETFAAHSGMPLRWDDFTAKRINWNEKSLNLIELADELGVSLDSFVFLEDDSKESAEVRQNCPEVLTLQIPAESGDLCRFLKRSWLFDQFKPLTKEDTHRTRLYAEQYERKQFQHQVKSLSEFLRGLQIEITFAPIITENYSRVAQLSQRTNQMNTSLVRYREPDLRQAIESRSLDGFALSLKDRFGSYGLVGVVLFTLEVEDLLVRNFFLSCRALGRGVEHRMLSRVAEIAVENQKGSVVVETTRGPRNRPALQFLETLEPFTSSDHNNNGRLVFSAQKLVDLDFMAMLDATQPALAIEEGTSRSRGQQTDTLDYQRIALEFSTAAGILAAMNKPDSTHREAPREVANPPEGYLQIKLAAIWCELLGLNAIGANEDFFDLGGHSLLAVQLLARVHRDFGVELPASVIYAERLTLASLALSIQLVQLGMADRQSYESALAEIESLTDEEVTALLAEEGLSSPSKSGGSASC